jgi:hypothetical protein
LGSRLRRKETLDADLRRRDGTLVSVTTTLRLLAHRRETRNRDRDSTANRNRDRTSTANRNRDRDSTANRNRDRTSTATRSGTNETFDRRPRQHCNRDSTATATALQPRKHCNRDSTATATAQRPNLGPPQPRGAPHRAPLPRARRGRARRTSCGSSRNTGHRVTRRQPDPALDAICRRPEPNRVGATAKTDSQSGSPAVGEVRGRLRPPGSRPDRPGEQPADPTQDRTISTVTR